MQYSLQSQRRRKKKIKIKPFRAAESSPNLQANPVKPAQATASTVANPTMVMKETVNASIKPSAENRAKIFNSPDFISIKQLTSTAKAAVESVTQTIAESQQEERLRAFNQQEFEEAWKDFTAKKLANNALAQSAFQVALLKLNEDYSVEVSFPSTTQEYYFNDLKSQLAEFLKNEYRMNGITYKVLVQKSDEVRVSSVMSEKDKFEAMREKNPALEELRKRFGLEIPY